MSDQPAQGLLLDKVFVHHFWSACAKLGPEQQSVCFTSDQPSDNLL